MPWIEPPPTVEEKEFWEFTKGTFFHFVAKWPHPNTPRIDCRFRVKNARPTLIPLASRWGFYSSDGFLTWTPLNPPYNLFGWWDAEVRADNRIGFTSEVSPTGWLLDVNIRGLDDLEFLGGPGIEIEHVTTHPTFGSSRKVSEWPVELGIPRFWYNQNTNFFRTNPTWTITEESQNWPQAWNPWIFAVDECYPFKPFPVGMAAMNGTDSYISLDHNIPRLDVPFKISADIRLHNVTSFWPLFGLDNSGGFTGMDEDDTIFGFLRIGTTWVPVLDVWFNWRFEFEQVSQLNYRTFIDDVQVDESTFGRQFSHRNMLGVYKHGVSGTIWADMDVKNLKLTIGDVPSTNVVLDMPLIDNALDLSPDANHGTTFGMDLPSV